MEWRIDFMKHLIYGSMIGDIAGSRFEWNPYKSKKGYDLISESCQFTDDTVMTAAIASAIMRAEEEHIPLAQAATEEMQFFGRMYPYAGYGGRFASWIRQEHPEPYWSWGNGSAMRASPCGYAALSLDEALKFAEESAMPTHNHPEGIKGAKATAAAVFLAKTGASLDTIRDAVEKLGYRLDYSIDEIRPAYSFDVSCQGSVPQSIACFLQSSSYEDTIRNAISLGGDSDTMAAISGGIAWGYYWNKAPQFEREMESLVEKAQARLPEPIRRIAKAFDAFCLHRNAVRESSSDA